MDVQRLNFCRSNEKKFENKAATVEAENGNSRGSNEGTKRTEVRSSKEEEEYKSEE